MRRWRSRDCVWKPDRYVLHDLLKSHHNVVITTSIKYRQKLGACLSIVLELSAVFLVSCSQTAGVTVWHRLTRPRHGGRAEAKKTPPGVTTPTVTRSAQPRQKGEQNNGTGTSIPCRPSPLDGCLAHPARLRVAAHRRRRDARRHRTGHPAVTFRGHHRRATGTPRHRGCIDGTRCRGVIGRSAGRQ